MSFSHDIFVRLRPGLSEQDVVAAFPEDCEHVARIPETDWVDADLCHRDLATELAEQLAAQLDTDVILLAHASANDSVVFLRLSGGRVARRIEIVEATCTLSEGKREAWEGPLLKAATGALLLGPKRISERTRAFLDAKEVVAAIEDGLGIYAFARDRRMVEELGRAVGIDAEQIELDAWPAGRPLPAEVLGVIACRPALRWCERLAFTDGALIATSGGELARWRLDAEGRPREEKPSTLALGGECLAFGPNGKTAVVWPGEGSFDSPSLAQDRPLRVIETIGAQPIATLALEAGYRPVAAQLGERDGRLRALVTALPISGPSDDVDIAPGQVHLFDGETGAPLRRFTGELGALCAATGMVAVLPTRESERVLLFDADGAPAGELAGDPAAGVDSIGFDPTGRRLAVRQRGPLLRVWAARPDASLPSGLAWAESALLDVGPAALEHAFAADGESLAVGHMYSLSRWELDPPRAVASLRGHADDVGPLAFAPDGRALASADAGGRILIWRWEG